METETIQVPIQKSKKQWFSPKLRIAFRLFLCFWLFISIIDRWRRTGDLMENVSTPLSLNPAYAKEIDVETYLMTREQLKQLFPSSAGSPLIQWEEKQTGFINDLSPLYFVLRLRNQGDSYAWGRLQAHSKRWRRGTGIEEREIPVQLLPPRMKDFKTIILAASENINGFESPSRQYDKNPPTITTEWISLYASKSGGEDGS